MNSRRFITPLAFRRMRELTRSITAGKCEQWNGSRWPVYRNDDRAVLAPRTLAPTLLRERVKIYWKLRDITLSSCELTAAQEEEAMELGLSAFIAGTALGYLIWYWVRNGGAEATPAGAATTAAARPAEPSGLGKPRVQVALILTCAFLLVMLLIAMGFETSHPMGPSGSLIRINHWIIIAVVVVVIVLLGMLFYSSARRLGTSIDVFAGVFKATLAVVFGFILAMFIVLIVWGPLSFYLNTWDGFIAASRLGPVLLGMAFGSVGAEWINYMMREDGLKTASMELQHRRWGYILLTILAIGIIYPFLPPLVGKIGSANVTTPLGGISFSTEPVSTIRNHEGPERVGNETSKVRIWDAFKDVSDLSDRDQAYAKLFYQNRPDKKLNRLTELHTDASKFVTKVLNPLGKCLDAHFSRFNNSGLIQRRFNDAIVHYTRLVHSPVAGQVDAADLLAALAKAAGELNDEIKNWPGDIKNEEPCGEAQKSIAGVASASTQISLGTPLPYAAMGLAFLLYDSGETEQAMRELASWVEDHYLTTTADRKIEECNRKNDTSCAYYGYKPDADQKETAKWEKLPAWYRVRIEFELIEMMSVAANQRVTYAASHALVYAIESLFSESEIKSAYDWAGCGSPIANVATAPKQGTPNEVRESRMVAAYFSLVDKMLRTLTRVADEGLLDEEVDISPEMLKYGEKNSAVELHCLSYYQDRADDRQTLTGEYKATYGILLTQSILRRETHPANAEYERAGHKDAIAAAGSALRFAIPILKRQIDLRRGKLAVKRLDERLFPLLEEQDYLSRATAALKTLDELN